MSEDATAVAVETPAAPSEAAAAPVTTAVSAPEGTLPVVASTKPTSSREAREALRARVQGKGRDGTREAQQPTAETRTKPNAAGEQQPIDASGKYAPKGEAVAAPAPTDAATPVVATPSEAPKPVVADRIELPEQHTLRKDRGKRFLDELAPHEYRAVAKDLARVAELEALTGQLQTDLARQRAEAEIRTDPTKDPLSDPMKRARYNDILSTYGKEDADAYRKGLEGDVSGEIAKKTEQIVAAERTRSVAQRFKADLASFSQSVAANAEAFPAWKTQYGELERQIVEGVNEFSTLVERGLRQPTIEAFHEDLRMKYIRDPRAAAMFQKRSEQEAARKQAQLAADAQAKADEAAAQREAEALLQASQVRGRNPLGRLPVPGVGVGGAVGPTNAREAIEARKARRMGRLRG